MFNRRLALIFGSVAIMSAGALGVACGTDNGTTPLPGDNKDASTGNGDGSVDPGTDSGTPDMDSGVVVDMDAGVDCGKLPTLHPPGPGAFCPFQEGGTGDASAKFFGNCAAGQTCCDYQGATSPTEPPATCMTGTAVVCPPAPANYTLIPWECDTASQCQTAGNVCCMFTSPFGVDAGKTVGVAPDTIACSSGALLKGKYVGGTKCEAACGAGEIKVCGSDADCTSPSKCVAFSTNAKNLGICK